MQLYRKVDAPNWPFTHVFAEAGWPWLLFGLFLTSLTRSSSVSGCWNTTLSLTFIGTCQPSEG